MMGPRTRRMLTNWRGTTMNPLSPCIADAAPRRSRRGSGTASPATASARLRSPTRNGSMPARRNPRSVRRRIPSTAPASRRSTSSSGIPHPSRLPRPSVESHPQLVEATARLLAFYRQTVGSPYSEDGADAAIMALLAGGTTEKRLTGAIRRYARDCDKQRLDNTARKGAPAFFASAWQEYAPAESPPLQPYEPRAVLSDEEFAARPGLARKSALVDEHFSKHLVGDDRRGRPDSFIARILLDGVPPIELLAAAQGYARHAAKEALPQNERILSPEFFVAEWQRWRTHPPDCWATELADELAKSEAQLAEELAAAMSKHELRIAKRSEMTRPQPTSVPARPVAQAEPPT